MQVDNVKVYSVKWTGKNPKEIEKFKNKFSIYLNIIDDVLYVNDLGGYIPENTIIYYIPKFKKLFFR